MGKAKSIKCNLPTLEIWYNISINSSFAYLVGTVSIYPSSYLETRLENDLFPTILQNTLLNKIDMFPLHFKKQVAKLLFMPKCSYVCLFIWL